MTNLSVNVNKIAWLRNARGEDRPNLIEISKILIEAGIQGLTVHPRPDLRHITPDDVYDLSLLCKDHGIEFNIEGNPFSEETKLYPGFVQLVKAIEPDQCTLVPDAIDQLTSDHGWDLHLKDHNSIKNIIAKIRTSKTRVSFFVDPVKEHIEAIKTVGGDRVELYTGPYAANPSKLILDSYQEAYQFAKSLGLDVNAGHDLDLNNLKQFLTVVPADEVSIGHALVSDSLIYGIKSTTTKYLELCK